jgi:hypothetical protein
VLGNITDTLDDFPSKTEFFKMGQTIRMVQNKLNESSLQFKKIYDFNEVRAPKGNSKLSSSHKSNIFSQDRQLKQVIHSVKLIHQPKSFGFSKDKVQDNFTQEV